MRAFSKTRSTSGSGRRNTAPLPRRAVRSSSHAGSSYPGEAEELSALLRDYVDHGAPCSEEGDLIGIAAPHISLEGGRDCYRAAYGALPPEYKDRTFVVLGTSHYGQPEKFGLTRKPFETPFGVTGTDVALVEELNREAPGAVVMEDYCHAVEHSIEFQVIFLQHLYGPSVRIVPILCGSYAHSLYEGGSPEDDPGVARFLEVLGGVAAREGKRLFWVLGIDMAHQGPRYGDEVAMEAHHGDMADVAERERRRIELVEAGDARGFWESVQQRHDDLRWCGASALYTLLKTMPGVKGRLLRYDQWNIDEQSVVSFGAIAFQR